MHGVHEGIDFYVIVGFYDDPPYRCCPGEVFVKIAKHGSMLAEFVGGWSVLVSMVLQSGWPWSKVHAKFESEGLLSAICAAVSRAIDERSRIVDEPVYQPPVEDDLAPNETLKDP